MTLYVDSSALLERYVDEHDSAVAVEPMGTDPVLVTSRITEIEVRRNLARLLDGDPWTACPAASSRSTSTPSRSSAWTPPPANEAAAIAERTGCRSSDALHLGSAMRAGASTTVLTFDIRQAQAARAIGLTAIGV